uniref:Uncharacterized protein n=1 Tax=Arundo donax TaxID=35708 RepID=A0A0A9CA49_ARUDO
MFLLPSKVGSQHTRMYMAMYHSYQWNKMIQRLILHIQL